MLLHWISPLHSLGWGVGSRLRPTFSTHAYLDSNPLTRSPRLEPSCRSSNADSIVTSHPSAKSGPGLPAAMPPIPDESSPASYYSLSSPSDHFTPKNPQPGPAHSRETSNVRGRPADPSVLTSSTLQPQHSRRGTSHSKSPETSSGRPGYDAGLERRPSNSYGHHRQTSIVHGIQHSRNSSFAASASPLTPEMMATLSRNGVADSENTAPGRSDQSDMHSGYHTPGSNGSSHHAQAPLSTIEDQDGGGVPDDASALPLHRRMNSSGLQRREQPHSRSHSKHHHSESKTVGEYALHHLFNSVRTNLRRVSSAVSDMIEVCGPCRQQNKPGHHEARGFGLSRRASMRPWH